jgi:hypothetical protein
MSACGLFVGARTNDKARQREHRLRPVAPILGLDPQPKARAGQETSDKAAVTAAIYVWHLRLPSLIHCCGPSDAKTQSLPDR